MPTSTKPTWRTLCGSELDWPVAGVQKALTQGVSGLECGSCDRLLEGETE